MTGSRRGKPDKFAARDGAGTKRKARTRGRNAPRSAPSMDNNTDASPPEPGLPAILSVVGLVASAGGLDAYKAFLDGMPVNSGMAFVLIPHLDPRHESLMAPLLARHTDMSITEAREQQPLQPDHIYVIPPDRYLTLRAGVIQLSRPPARAGGETAIDPFLLSLANDQQERAICVILSGTGNHGTLGLKAVKSAGGMVMVQEPSTAEYDRMPRSAIDTGLVDYVLPPGDMPAVLMKYVRHLTVAAAGAPEPAAVKDDLEQVLALLRERSNFDFLAYRKRMLLRRIQRRMGLIQLERLSDYLALLREQPEEVERLARDLFISVTSFFRDPEMFHILETRVLPALLEARGAHDAVRVWVPGCATGEEAYSLAMLLVERVGAIGRDSVPQVFATDVDRDALEVARRGVYPESVLMDLNRQRLERFFTRVDDGHWQVKKPLREIVLFAPHNLLSDTPFSRLDLVSCRNLFIYLEPQVQQTLLELFHFALNDGGFLILGPAESIGRQLELYQPLSKKWRIFRRTSRTRRAVISLPVQPGGHPDRLSQTPATGSAVLGNLSELTRNTLLDDYAPAAVVIDQHYQVHHYAGPAHLYLQQPGGAPSQDLLTLANPGLRPRLRAAVQRAMQEYQRVDIGGIGIIRAGRTVTVRLSSQPLRGKGTEGLFLVTFQDVPGASEHAADSAARPEVDEELVQQLEHELKTTREELQSTIEELESGNEELRASNEEVMSVNEEMQSSNEELETSKEELQSLNEELSSVNAQLQDKVKELEGATDDMANLMASVDVPILFLAANRTIHRYTPGATRLFNLIDSDIGRPLSHITMRFEDPELTRDIDQALQGTTPPERELRTEQDQWYLRRITAYRTASNRMEGIVLSFTDVTPHKRAELELRDMAESLEQRVVERSAQLRQERNFNNAILDTVASLIIVVDTEGRVVRFNRACEMVTGYNFAEFVGSRAWWKLVPEEEREQVGRVVVRLMAGEEHVDSENHWLTSDGARRLLCWRNTVIKDAAGRILFIVGSGLDVTEQRAAEDEARHHLEEASRLQRLQTANELATLLAHEINTPLGAITMYAETGEQVLGHSPLEQERLAELLAQISRQSLRVGEIIRRLRTFVGRGRLEPVALDLNAVMRNACALMESRARSSDISLVLDLNAGLRPVRGVDVHIEQVLLNLIRNAIEAIHGAGMTGGTVTVTSGMHTGEEMAQVCVRDTGPGIDAETAGSLFGSLASDKEYGLGVGLRISHSLVEAQGGRLWAEPHTPGGVFWFTLPLAS
jgi:two-component system, chemotaxis family, CheB/CheR fusion protein